MSLVRLLAPPALQLLAFLLVLMTLVSPVPYHTSSISLIYVAPTAGKVAPPSSIPRPAPPNTTNAEPATTSPASSVSPVESKANSSPSSPPLLPSPTVPAAFPTLSQENRSPFPTAPARGPDTNAHPRPPSSDTPAPPDTGDTPPPKRRTLPGYSPLIKRDDPRVLKNTHTGDKLTSYVQYTVGLLGSCYMRADKSLWCTGSSVHPLYNNEALVTAPDVHLNTSRMLRTLSFEPTVVVISLMLTSCTTVFQMRRLYTAARLRTASPLGSTPLVGITYALLRTLVFVQQTMAIILLITMLSLRVRVARANEGFNADNSRTMLGPKAFSQPSREVPPLVLQAETGTAFACTCLAAVLLYALAWLERRRLTKEHVLPVPKDTESEASTGSEANRERWKRLARMPMSEVAAPPPPPRPRISYPIPVADVGRATWPEEITSSPPRKSPPVPASP